MSHRAFAVWETDPSHDRRAWNPCDRKIDYTWKLRPDGSGMMIIVCGTWRGCTDAVGQTAVHDGEVFSVDLPALHRIVEDGSARHILRNQHQPAGVFIKPVDTAVDK